MTATALSIIEPLDNEAVGNVNTNHFESLVTDDSVFMGRFRFNHDDVATTGNDFFPIDCHSGLAGADDANLGIRMLMQCWTFSRCKVAEEKGSAGAIGLALELHCGDIAFPLIARMQDVERSLSFQFWRVTSLLRPRCVDLPLACPPSRHL
jgi:hypothetical protein